MSTDYLDGLERSHVHKLWLLKTAARKNGRKESIISIANALLADALTDAHMDELEARFCRPPDPFIQQPLLKD